MSDEKRDAPGPDEHKKLLLATPDDTEGHRKKMPQATGEPDGGPDEMKHKMPLGIPDSDDTVGHKRESGEDPLSARPRQPLAIPDSEGDTEGHKK